MHNIDLRRFHCVQGVLEFARRFPDLAPAAITAVTRLEHVDIRVRDLLNEFLAAQHAATTALQNRNSMLHALRQKMAHLIRLARVAAAHEEIADLRFRVVFGVGSLGDYWTAARAAVATALTYRAVLLRYGMPEALLEDLTLDLDRCEAAQKHRTNALATCTRVHADLRDRGREAVQGIRHLDALNRIRFANDPERLAEWEAAKRQATGDRLQATTAGEGR